MSPRLMFCLDLTLSTPAENLAADEALLDWGEKTGGEALRFWEPTHHFVVVGYANKVAVEVNESACAAHRVAIHRRCSGGGTVLQGPGCLNYSLVLQALESGPLIGITETNRFVMERHRTELESLLGQPVAVDGHTDLVAGGRKFSGNAQRRKRRALLFHGTFLWGFDFSLVERFLKFPSWQPAYRRSRSHSEFLMNLPLSPRAIKQSLRRAWQAEADLAVAPLKIAELATKKYGTAAWNLKF